MPRLGVPHFQVAIGAGPVPALPNPDHINTSLKRRFQETSDTGLTVSLPPVKRIKTAVYQTSTFRNAATLSPLLMYHPVSSKDVSTSVIQGISILTVLIDSSSRASHSFQRDVLIQRSSKGKDLCRVGKWRAEGAS
jgi:hypothetical protein